MHLLGSRHLGRHVQQFGDQPGAPLLGLHPVAFGFGELLGVLSLCARLFRFELVDQTPLALVVGLLTLYGSGHSLVAALGGGQLLFGDGYGRSGSSATESGINIT